VKCKEKSHTNLLILYTHNYLVNGRLLKRILKEIWCKGVDWIHMAPEAHSCIHSNESFCFIPSYLLGSPEQLHYMELVIYNSLIKILHA
jgi:hypothetical protein